MHPIYLNTKVKYGKRQDGDKNPWRAIGKHTHGLQCLEAAYQPDLRIQGYHRVYGIDVLAEAVDDTAGRCRVVEAHGHAQAVGQEVEVQGD